MVFILPLLFSRRVVLALAALRLCATTPKPHPLKMMGLLDDRSYT